MNGSSSRSQPREQTGSREARRLRREGLIPGVLYGRGNEPHPFSVPERELRKVLTGGSGMHAILDVVLDGEEATHPSILKDYQQDPLRGKLVHIDLQEVRLDQAITASVTVVLVGAEDAPGVREGGALSQIAREVNVEALPLEVPEHLELDVSGWRWATRFASPTSSRARRRDLPRRSRDRARDR